MYRTLNADLILATIERLRARISERFPESGLSRVCGEVLEVARKSKERCDWVARPRVGLRVLVGLTIAVGLAVLIGELFLLAQAGDWTLGRLRGVSIADAIQIHEAGMNAVVLIGAAILFLVTVESRVKRSRALAAVHELRALAHVVDMHQLTKDPQRILRRIVSTEASPRETLTPDQLARYLDYCSEMLSLIGKLAALYVQRFSDTAVLAAVNEVETLTTGLSRKIWQKIMILHRLEEGDEGAAGGEERRERAPSPSGLGYVRSP